MSGSSVIMNYAEAVADSAAQYDILSTVSQDLLFVKNAFTIEPLLLIRLRMPSLNRSQRNKIIDGVFEERIHPLTLRLLHLLVIRGRIYLLPELFDAFKKVCDKRDGITDVTVTSVLPVDVQQKTDFETIIRKRFGSKSRIVYMTDPALIAGYCISTKESMLDCSVRSNLIRLRKQLLHN